MSFQSQRVLITLLEDYFCNSNNILDKLFLMPLLWDLSIGAFAMIDEAHVCTHSYIGRHNFFVLSLLNFFIDHHCNFNFHTTLCLILSSFPPFISSAIFYKMRILFYLFSALSLLLHCWG